MMTKQLLFRTVAAIAACLVLALPASAYSFVQDGIYYNVNGANVSVTYKTTSYNSYSGTVNIPATVTNGGTTYNVTSIGPSAFQNCTNLYRVVIPNSVTYLMNDAFKGCSKLTNITIPASVYTIYNNVFDGCTALKSVICLNPTPRPWNSNNFTSTTYTNAQLIVPKGKLSDYQSSTYCWGSFTSIQEMDCDFVEDAIFYDKLDNNMVEVTHALRFADSYGEEYIVPIGTQIIDVEAFRGASALTAVSLPNGLKRIERLAFMDCSALTTLEMPSTLTSVGYSAFSNAPLTTLTVKATTPPTCEIRIEPHSGTVSEPFNNTHYNNCTLIVPRGSKSAYQDAAIWKKFTHIVEADLPADYIRGDVNDDGVVGMDDLTALINYLVFNDASNINLDAADANEDGVVGMDDLTVLINYLVYNTWPAPAPIDMWYLWGNFIGETPWGDVYGNNPIGTSALSLYPSGTINAQGKGLLTWTGYIPRQYFTIVHSAGYYDDLASEAWMVDQNGNYHLTSLDEGENNGYSTFLLDAGYYTINLNTAAMNLSIVPAQPDNISFGSICIVGSFNYWSNTANPMEMVNPRLSLSNSDWWVDTWTITQTNEYGDVKFCNYDDWNYNWGADTFPYGCGVQGGPNIPATPGTYKVFFNDITGLYNFIKME